MDNPEAVAWVMSAEGSIGLHKTNHGRSLNPRICVYNTEEQFVTKFRDMVGYGNVCCHSDGNHKHKSCYEWHITTSLECLGFLLDIKPYLPTKQEQAEILAEFCARALNAGRHIPSGRYRPKVTEVDWIAYETTKLLNQKGPKL